MTQLADRIAFSVIMPAYNEASRIQSSVRETLQVMAGLGEPFEIIVVDDGSRDGTAEAIRPLTRETDRVKLLCLTLNQGKGQALREGFTQSRGDLVLFLDADLDLHPRQVTLFYRLLQERQADAVIGSKRHPQSVLHYPWKRRLVSAVYFFLVKMLFGLPIKDTQTGLKLFRRPVLADAFPKMLVKKYAFDLELLVLAHYHGFKIVEAPVIVEYHTKYGHIGLQAIFKIWWDTMAIWYRLYLRHYYDKVKPAA